MTLKWNSLGVRLTTSMRSASSLVQAGIVASKVARSVLPSGAFFAHSAPAALAILITARARISFARSSPSSAAISS